MLSVPTSFSSWLTTKDKRKQSASQQKKRTVLATTCKTCASDAIFDGMRQSMLVAICILQCSGEGGSRTVFLSYMYIGSIFRGRLGNPKRGLPGGKHFIAFLMHNSPKVRGWGAPPLYSPIHMYDFYIGQQD
jgi:hypothetical protein